MTRPSVLQDTSIRQETIDFIKSAMEQVCKANEMVIRTATRVGWQSSQLPTGQLHLVQLVKEYCNLDYPGLHRDQDFFAGVTIEIREPDKSLPGTRDRPVIMMFTPDHKQETPYISLDLTFMQEELANPAAEWPEAIETAIFDAMALEEKELWQYRRRSN